VDVVILVAGQGTRMRPLTHDRPKAMLLAAGEPVLHHLLSDLQHVGADRVILVVGHGHDVVQTFVGDGSRYGLRVQYVRQAKQLGAGHALSQAQDAIQSDEFVLLAGDAWYAPTVLASLLDGSGPALIQVPDVRAARYGLPVVRGTEVVDIQAAGPEASSHPCGGAYRLHRRILPMLPETQYKMVEALRKDMRVHDGWTSIPVAARSYVDIIEVQDLLELHGRLMETVTPSVEGTVEPGVHMTGAVSIGKGSLIRAGCVLAGPVVVGEHCDIGPSVVLDSGTAIRNQVRVEPFSYLSHCVVGSNVAVGSHTKLHRAYVDRGAELASGSHVPGGRGSILGSDCAMGPDARLEPNGSLGRGARVAGGRSVHTVPDHGMAV
jgi:UDP-N-acetylglucosamine diphosphorylase / glucose-1-phosphate thymidylyltransferase / UDP-N-acetylgalactosamine diphosphorylase / glucosamine-1-phosphate N-acetyltransferase / galactosamine-1-phosphate N-acetyltransferase